MPFRIPPPGPYDTVHTGLTASTKPLYESLLGPFNPNKPLFYSSWELMKRAIELLNAFPMGKQKWFSIKSLAALVLYIPKFIMLLSAGMAATGLLFSVDFLAAALHTTAFSVYRSVARAWSMCNYIKGQNKEPHSGEKRNPVLGSLSPFREHSLPVEIHLDVKAALERFESLMGYTKNSLDNRSTLKQLHKEYQALEEAQIACDRLHKGDPPKIIPGKTSEEYKKTCEARDAARTAFNEAINNRLETREAYLNARTKVRTIQNKINELNITIEHNLQDIKKFKPIMEEAKTKIDRLQDEIDALEGNTASIAEAGDIELRPLLLNGALERTTTSTAEAPATEPPVEDKNAETLQQQLDRKTNGLALEIEKQKTLKLVLDNAINAREKNTQNRGALEEELAAATLTLQGEAYEEEEEEADEAEIGEKNKAIEREITNLRQVKGGLTNEDKNKAVHDGYAIWYGADKRPCVLVDPVDGSPIKLNKAEITEFSKLINEVALEAGNTATPAAKIDKSSGSRIFGSGKSIYFQDANKYDLGRYLLTQYKKIKGENESITGTEKKEFLDKIKKVYFDKSCDAKLLLENNPSETLDELCEKLTKMESRRNAANPIGAPS